MTFCASCPLCSRTISAFSMFVLRMKMSDHALACLEKRERELAAKAARDAQGSLF